jgi:flagellin-like protein
MINKYRDKLDEEGVSPVIGVILLVAVTVALVALATVIVFDIGSGVSDTADASVQMEQTDSGVQATIVRNENVDEFILRHEDGTEQRSTKSIGSFTYDNGDGEYTLIAVVGGNEEVIRSTTVVGAESGEKLSGTAEINSLIVGGATVEAYDAGGTLVDSTTTDANGQYELTVADASPARIVLNTEGNITYNGEPLHASAEQSGFSAGDTVNFNFDNTTATSGISVNGDSVTVVSALEGESSSVIEVGNLAQLQAMQGDIDADYKLIRDIDASGTVNWNNGQGFNPIGENYTVSFTGSFDGQNHTISNLSINRLNDNRVGLFGLIGEGGEVKNVGVINVNITGDWYVGGLVGSNSDGTVSNSYSTGNVTGEGVKTGGLVGQNDNGNISNSYSTGNVTGEKRVGGLVGKNNEGTVSNSYSTGNVTGGDNGVGGLVGSNSDGTVSNSYSTGNVTGEERNVGGLVGQNDEGNISNSYSTGNVTGELSDVGGLVGKNNDIGNISNSYSTGNVSGEEQVGGLVGYNYGTVSNSYSTGNVTGELSDVGGLVGKNNDIGNISNSYSTGNVSGEEQVGGLVGYNYGTVSNSYSTGNVTGESYDVGGVVGFNDNGNISNSYWDTEATGQSSSAGLPDSNGLTTSQMQGSSASTEMIGFDFTDTWSTVEGDYPELQWQE